MSCKTLTAALSGTSPQKERPVMARRNSIRNKNFLHKNPNADMPDFDMSNPDDRQIAEDLEMCIREDNRKDPMYED